MSFPVVSFANILTQCAAAADLAYDPAQSIDELSTNTKLKFATFINSAMDRIWRAPNPAFAWKWTTTNVEITLDADGMFAWDEIENSDDWFNLWDRDPRPQDNPPGSSGWWIGNSARALRSTEDYDGVWPRVAGQQTVFAFYRMPRPKFTNVAVNTATSYAAGSLVYDPSGTGHCYLANAASAPGNNLADSKWTRQAIPERVADVLADFAEQLRLDSKAEEARSMGQFKVMNMWLDEEMRKELPREGGGPPWCWDRRSECFMNCCSY